MVDAILKTILGDWGTIVLEFYRENSLVINIFIFLYAIIVFFSRRTYYGMLDTLVSRLMNDYGNKFNGRNSEQIEKILDRMTIDKTGLVELNRFPFISPPSGIIPNIKSNERVNRVLNNNVLAGEIYRRTNIAEKKNNAKHNDKS